MYFLLYSHTELHARTPAYTMHSDDPFLQPTIIECASETEGLGTWRTLNYGFNSFPEGLLTLFTQATVSFLFPFKLLGYMSCSSASTVSDAVTTQIEVFYYVHCTSLHSDSVRRAALQKRRNFLSGTKASFKSEV